MKEQIKQTIEQFLRSNEKSISVPMYPITKYKEILEELGFIDLEQYDTNGYQVDFWDCYDKDGIRYCLSGDLWYRETWTFSKEV